MEGTSAERAPVVCMGTIAHQTEPAKRVDEDDDFIEFDAEGAGLAEMLLQSACDCDSQAIDQHGVC